jgi:hypothetical protein
VSDYSAARTVAPIVREHFARSIAGLTSGRAGSPGSDVADVPDVEAIEAIVDVAFWTSLRREEGYAPKISLALVPPDGASQPLRFERPLTLTTTALARVAPAVERPGIHLGVWRARDGDGELSVWGATRTIPTFTFVLEVAAPGLLVVKHHRGETGKFVNVAVLEGEQVKVIDEHASSLPDCPTLVASLVGFDTPVSPLGSVNVLVQLAVSMRAHGRGGSLLIVPAGSEVWRESIVRPVRYAISPAFSKLADLVGRPLDDRDHRSWQDALAAVIDAIAGLTAVDGATVMTDQYELLAFGAKIARRRGSAQVEQVTVTEPILGGTAEVVHPTRLGGTRHLSAAQFVHDEHEAIALVASQDGRFTVFAWSPCEEMVHAHRVETLLL